MFGSARRKRQSALVGNKRTVLKYVARYVVFIIAGCMLTTSTKAASFVIVDGQVVTTGQTLNDNETGEIKSGGQLNTGNFVGINAPGDDVSINNSGMLSTTGDDANGIFSSGDNTSMNNSGLLSTTGDDANGIWSSGDNASITNSGTISMIGFNARGIYARGDGITINNSGTLSTTGESASGINIPVVLSNGAIFARGANISINNSGAISTLGLEVSSIYLDGANASINNSGTLSTTGGSAHGIKLVMDSDDAAINNNGTISTTGLGADCIHSRGDDASINNRGTLSTKGYSSQGITSWGDNVGIKNSGTLSTTGGGADGIFSGGSNACINNSGSIQVTGMNSKGIWSIGADGVMTISGNVFATGNATQAIVGDNNQTLNLLPGYRIIGSIDLGPGSNTVNISGGKTSSSTLTIGNPGTINLLGGVPIVRNGNVVAVVDPTTQTANRAALSLTMDSIHQAVNQQLMSTPPSKPVQVAASQLLPGMLHQDPRPYVWGHLFGGYREREDDENAIAYEHDMYGLVCGYENTIGRHRVGVFAGVAQSDIETDIDSIEIDTDRLFIGAYGQHIMGNWVLNGSVIVGYGDHDTDRTVLDNLSGFETARSDYDSVSISPSLTLIRTYECKSGIELRPSVQLAYTYAYFDDYREKGTTRSNLRVDSRDVNIVSGRLQLAGSYALTSGRGEVELRGGMKMRHYGNNSVHVDLNGSQLSYKTAGDNNVLGGYFGANVRYQIKDRLDLVGNAEYGQASGEERSISGYLGLTFSF